MVARTLQCDPVRLKSFLDDELPEREQVELNDHLETCAYASEASSGWPPGAGSGASYGS